MSIEIVSIGDELLAGFTVNTNAAYLGLRLQENGWDVKRQTTLPDEITLLKEGLREVLQRASLVITTGGIGPTLDDRSEEAMRALFSSKPHPIPNHVGSAAGLIFEESAKIVLMLPGVPQEMKPMFETSVLPFLEKRLPKKKKVFQAALYFCCTKETELDPYLRQLEKEGVRCGVYPSYGTTAVRLYAPSQNQLDGACAVFLKNFSDRLFDTESGHIEQAIQKQLVAKRQTLAVAESCTGGMIASKLTQWPGASDYFLGACVVYSNQLKESILGVLPQTLNVHGAVSSQVAEEMLLGLFQKTSCDWGIAVTGIAGPTGGSLEKPVGTVWYALGKRSESPLVGCFKWGTRTRAAIMEISTSRVLELLWQRLRG